MLHKVLRPAYWAMFGAVMGFALGGTLVWSWQQSPTPWYGLLEKPTDWLVAIFTGLLVIIAVRQIFDTRILQRAYVSVEPLGIEAMFDGAHLIGHVGIRNAGHLPARFVSWFIDMKYTTSGDEADFPLKKQTGIL